MTPTTASKRPAGFFLVVFGGLALFVLAVGLAISACTAVGSDSLLGDAATVLPGCYAPEACWSNSCSCHRASVVSECRTCDPTTAAANTSCDCSGRRNDGGSVPMPETADGFIYTQDGGASQCLEQTNVCVGRGVLCPGSGARCLAAGSSCSVSSMTFDTPQLVNSGSGFAPHCPYVDDVCCPGTIVDMAVPDLAVNAGDLL